MKKPGFNNIDNNMAKRIKDSILSDGEILVSGGAFEGNIDPLVESRIEAERAEIDSQMAQIMNDWDFGLITSSPTSSDDFGSIV